jgi:hypothetical protein
MGLVKLLKFVCDAVGDGGRHMFPLLSFLALGVVLLPSSISAASPGAFEVVGSTQVSAMMVCKKGTVFNPYQLYSLVFSSFWAMKRRYTSWIRQR